MSSNMTSGTTIDVLITEGEDATKPVIQEVSRFPGKDDTVRKINIGMPSWMIDELDAIARHYAVPRQAVINMWLAERLAAERKAVADTPRG